MCACECLYFRLAAIYAWHTYTYFMCKIAGTTKWVRADRKKAHTQTLRSPENEENCFTFLVDVDTGVMIVFVVVVVVAFIAILSLLFHSDAVHFQIEK